METSQTTINGIIIPAEWNDRGHILGIAIVTFDEDTFLVADNAFAKTLTGFLRKTVTIFGQVTVCSPLKKINVTQFQIHDT
ncbi:MAG: hypothetical protein KKF12_19510 [Proteobacteria bacterium]|nr:hypothetical protein [Desulfobacula sp.]MBU3952087.1 hypothetical protein [Pseudomonadota bacterium]MBU4133013.1 hypothetical protein [Pseudomonadota bacterium]